MNKSTTKNAPNSTSLGEKEGKPDLISRQTAIDEIKSVYEWHDFVTMERLIEYLNNLPSAQPVATDTHETAASGAVSGRWEGMRHKFNLWRDGIYPILSKLVGKRYGCCGKLRNCTRCIKRNGWEE